MELGIWNGKELSVTMTIEKQVVTAKVTDDLAEMMMTLPNPRTRQGGFLHTFYVIPRKADPASKEYKGLGKAMLCAVINKLIQDGRLQSTDEIELEASGGNSTPAQQKALRESGMTDEEMKASLKKYKGLLGDLESYCREAEDREIEREDLVVTICNINENQRLVEYYKTYGFTQIPGEDRGFVTGMKGKVSGILSACSPKGGKKQAYSVGCTQRREPATRAQKKRLRHMRGTRRLQQD